MPNQDQTGPNRQGAATGKGQNFNQQPTNQDTSPIGALCRRLRAGGQGQKTGRGNGRGQGSGFRGQGRR